MIIVIQISKLKKCSRQCWKKIKKIELYCTFFILFSQKTRSCYRFNMFTSWISTQRIMSTWFSCGVSSYEIILILINFGTHVTSVTAENAKYYSVRMVIVNIGMWSIYMISCPESVLPNIFNGVIFCFCFQIPVIVSNLDDWFKYLSALNVS